MKNLRKVKIAAVIILIHGIMEVIGTVGSLMAGISGTVDIGEYMHFILPAFQENIVLVTYTSGIYGVLRIIGAIGLFKNRQWGLSLSIICSVITITLMMFILPAGVLDGVLSSSVLVLLLFTYYGDKKIIG